VNATLSSLAPCSLFSLWIYTVAYSNPKAGEDLSKRAILAFKWSSLNLKVVIFTNLISTDLISQI